MSGTLLSIAAGDIGGVHADERQPATKAKISLVKGHNRIKNIDRAIDLLGMNPVSGKDVLIKPNFNTADPFPASTHNDTLIQLIQKLNEMGASSQTIGERCGPPDTADVLRDKGIHALCKENNVGLINFEELPENQWQRIRPRGSHWQDGFDVAKPVLDSPCIVSTCCLKTHRYGGIFTMSLKLSVGITHKRNMRELHGARQNHMRKMIAEINQAYEPALILMDGMEVFVDGGPMTGKKKTANVIMAGTDRIAMDAMGLAVLKELGSNRDIMGTKIFQQEQIVRAVELGLGVSKPEEIELLTDDQISRDYAEKVHKILLKG